MIKETFKPVVGYEDSYLISDLGNLYSIISKRLMKPIIKNGGYLYSELKGKNKYIHVLVAEAFLDYKFDRIKSVVNHIDGNKSNNKLSNLEIISQRENTNHKNRIFKKPLSSKYIGVTGKNNNWRSLIVINRKQYHLGSFKTEIEAAAAYQKALKDWNEKSIIPSKQKDR